MFENGKLNEKRLFSYEDGKIFGGEYYEQGIREEAVVLLVEWAVEG